MPQTGPFYGTAASSGGGGTGTWASPTSADGAPNGLNAVWAPAPTRAVALSNVASASDVIVPGISGSPGNLTILSPSVLPGVNYSQAYPGITLYASGGTAPYTWTVVGGAMPAGVALASNGRLTGGTLSTGAGTYNFTIQCADSAGHSLTQGCSITVTNETLQTSSNDNGFSGFNYYGVNESAFNSGNMQVVPDLPEGTGWQPNVSGQVLQVCNTACYDPGNWSTTIQTTGPQQSPANSGTIVAGPETRQVWYYGGYGYSYEPPLTYFNSITTSYSFIPPAPNGITFPNEGAQLYEFCYDIWLNLFDTEIMVWMWTQGPRYPWGSWPSPSQSNFQPVPLTNPVNIPFPGGYNPFYGQIVNLPTGPNGSNMTYGFCYNVQSTQATWQSGTSYPVPRGPFNFIQVNSTGTAFNNTASGFINLWGPNGASGNGLINWLVNNQFAGGTAAAGVAGGVAAYTPTLDSVNFGVEVCCSGGTDYPANLYSFTSFTTITDKTWTAQTVTPH